MVVSANRGKANRGAGGVAAWYSPLGGTSTRRARTGDCGASNSVPRAGGPAGTNRGRGLRVSLGRSTAEGPSNTYIKVGRERWTVKCCGA